jgi:hypothetical protein
MKKYSIEESLTLDVSYATSREHQELQPSCIIYAELGNGKLPPSSDSAHFITVLTQIPVFMELDVELLNEITTQPRKRYSH